MGPKVRKYIRLLKIDFPLDRPVKVRTKKQAFVGRKPVHGSCEIRHGCYLIVLTRHPDESVMVDYLMHEWAHAFNWLDEPETEDHSPEFFDVYGEIYRHYESLPNCSSDRLKRTRSDNAITNANRRSRR